MKLPLILPAIFYSSVPVVLYLFPSILGVIVFSNLDKSPTNVDLTKPEALINHTINFYLSPEKGITVGVWQTLPASQWGKAVGKHNETQWYQQALGDGNPVILYLHGQSGTRAVDYRVDTLKVLSAAGFHVLALEYRGFGDSTGEPSEPGLTTDATFLFHWVKNYSGNSIICLWGHSLGSGVATNTAVELQKQGSPADAVVLEAPFTRIKDVIILDTIARLYLVIPNFKSFLCRLLERINIALPNDDNVRAINSSLLILHAKDDPTVPYEMGQKLYNISLEAKAQFNRDVQVELVTYPANLGYGHNDIDRDPDLPNVVQKFLKNVKK